MSVSAQFLARFLRLPDIFLVQHRGNGRNLSTPDSWEDNGALDPLKKSVDCLLPELPRERLPSRIRCPLRPFNGCALTFDLTALWQSATACPFSPLTLLCCWESGIPNGGGKMD